ncbi:unnamed protein product [Penicillium nalgiovense]|nr:unnamed protein product [Penicillium nalgiovense]
MITLELYTPFPSGENIMDLNEADIDHSGFYTDVDETLDITDSFDLQAYYYDMEASPLQTSHAEGRHSGSTDETITSEGTHDVIPSTLRRSQRLIERSRAV